MGCGVQFSTTESDSHSSSNAVGATAQPSDESDSSSDDDSPEYEMDVSQFYDDLLDYYSGSSEEDYYDSDEDLFGGDPEFRFGLRPARLAPKPLAQPKPNSKQKSNRSERTCLVYFTKNGERVGDAECVVPKGGFYPVVAMLSQGERVRVNFDPISG